MTKRSRRRQRHRTNTPPTAVPAQPSVDAAGPARRLGAGWWLFGGGIAAAFVLCYWLGSGTGPAGPPSTAREASGGTSPTSKDQTTLAEGKKAAAQPAKESADSFLEAFGQKTSADSQPSEPARSDLELEKTFQTILDTRAQLESLADRAKQWKGKEHKDDLLAALAERDRLLDRLNRDLASFEKELGRARQARPADAVPEWLTGELLIFVGGEPEEILPHLRRAAHGGLSRPRVFASLARAQTEANQLEPAYQSAAKALDLDGQDRYAWETFTRVALHVERLDELTKRLERSFPGNAPDWVETMRTTVASRQARWQAEQKLRHAADLPLVRLTIEHRRFARPVKDRPLTKIESTGVGEVILELFEDQAPATVANFVSLVEQKVYDGTRFYLAEPAALVAGGDPGSKAGDPEADGTGGPGYVIPDEFNAPAARGHFRGSLSMVSNGPHTAGSQFFITVVPMPELDGRCTVFGRVLKGQEVVDRTTLGRTNPHVGHFGRIIPGDLLLRAEVLRKRDHEYRVIKAAVK